MRVTLKEVAERAKPTLPTRARTRRCNVRLASGLLKNIFTTKPTLELVVALMALGAFLAAFAGPCAFAATIDIGGPRVPQVFGVVNMSGNFAAEICPVLVGVMFQWTANWNVILLMFAGVFLAGAACWVFVNPQRRVR